MPRDAVRPRRGPRHWRPALTAVVGALLVVSGLSGAAAAPPQPVSCTGPQNGIRSCIPLAPPDRNNIGHGTQDSAAYLKGNAAVVKTKTVVSLPLQLQRIYASETYHRIRPPKGSGVKPHTIYDQPAWVVTNPGPHPSYGVFPVQEVTVLAFGSIPVKAELHLTQTKNDKGLWTPINVHADGLDVPPNTFTVDVIGQLELRIDNVTVDGVPLDVGPDCHTATPIDIDLKGQDGYTVFVGGLLEGEITIPAFTGCTDGSQVTDPLFTGSISGPGNLLRLQQGALGNWDPSHPGDCAPFDTSLPTCEIPSPPPSDPPTDR